MAKKVLTAQGFATRQHKAKEKLRAKAFVALCKQHGLPEPTLEAQIIPDRKFAFDFCWIPWKVCLEVQGGVWSKGAHGRGSGIIRDMAKANLAAMRNYLI